MPQSEFYGKKYEEDGSYTAEYGEWKAEQSQLRWFSMIDRDMRGDY